MGFRSANAKRRSVQSLLAVATLIAASAASAVQVTLPPNALIASVGNTTIVPVSIADSTGVLGIAVSFTYDSAIASATQVQSTTLTTGCTVIPSIGSPGMVVITAACPSGLPTGQSGALFNVTFQGVANGTSPLTFAQTNDVPNGCLLNEGSPSCEPVNGQLSVGTVGPTATATSTATNTSIPATATATATATNTVPTATATPSSTATFTDTIGPSPTASNTATVTATPTVTNTPVSTSTFTATFTQTPTPTTTETPLATPTRTITNTPGATNTRPAIPVVPSPASPAGLLMIVALGAGLLWALVRVSKSH